MNPIAVGRSKLILAMLEEDVPLDQILQIWFLTCISSKTAKTFSAFCGKLRMFEKDEEVGLVGLVEQSIRIHQSEVVKVCVVKGPP